MNSPDIGSLVLIFSTRFLGIFIEALSFLLLGTLISGLIGVFVNKEDMTRLVPRNVIAAVLIGSLLGFLFTVCACGVVHVPTRLSPKRMPLHVGITLLSAAPAIEP